MKKIIKDGFIIVIISAMIGIVVNLLHPGGYVFVFKSKLQQKQSIVFISTDEAKFKFDNNVVQFIDTRAQYVFNDQHIKDAINIPAFPSDKCKEVIIKNKNIINSSREKLLYCDGMSCSSSSKVAEQILKTGYNGTLYILRDGFPGWKKKGFPIHK